MNSRQWTLMPYTLSAWYAFYVHGNGYIGFSGDVYNSKNNVRPTIYLNPNVEIIGGDGTSTDPYQLQLGN